MDSISLKDIWIRIERDNPWWQHSGDIIPEAKNARRVYFKPFRTLALNFSVKRAVVLLGPRRVGKTVMVKQLIHDAILDGIDPRAILYVSIDAPIYADTSLEKFLSLMPKDTRAKRRLVIFDEIQYLKDWQRHLKDLVDSYPNIKFVATGSAAAALRLKSSESGTGRFSHFMLPPLTFYEFLDFSGNDSGLISVADNGSYQVSDMKELNSLFVDYLNAGGYPEVVVNPEVRRNAEQFIRSDIVDKVLLKDLPSLYGIHEIPELNKLFSVLAYNTGNEISFENIAQTSGISKPTISKYIQYLESAFLILKLQNVDDNCRTLTRERNFKIYLNNPSMRAALFGPVKPTDSDKIGRLAECAIFSQWQHSPGFRQLRYARWKNRRSEGEVDIVYMEGLNQSPLWIGEIKWSDRLESDFSGQTRSLRLFLDNHKKKSPHVFFTTKTLHKMGKLDGRSFPIYPSAFYCYVIGRNITSALNEAPDIPLPATAE